jgi:hypothetical protein
MSADWLDLADALTYEKTYRCIQFVVTGLSGIPNHPAPFGGTALHTNTHLDTRAPGLTPPLRTDPRIPVILAWISLTL